MAKAPRDKPDRVRSWIVDDPAEIAAIEARDRSVRNTALRQVGCTMVVDAPLPLLAQYVVELPTDERQEFLTELVARLPAEVLRPLVKALRIRLDTPGA